MKSIIALIIISLFVKCKTTDTKDMSQTKKVEINTSMIQQSQPVVSVIEYNSDTVFSRYLLELTKSLANDSLPYFVYNPCLDCEEIIYCRVNSHKTRSLRTDLLKALTDTEKNKFQTLANSKLLSILCDDLNSKSILNGEYTWLEIFNIVKE